MKYPKLPLPVVVATLSLPLSGAVLAEQSAKLMHTGELACNDLCRAWMSMGDRAAVAGVSPNIETSTQVQSPMMLTGSARPVVAANAAARRTPVRKASAPHANVVSANRIGPARGQIAVRTVPVVPTERRLSANVADPAAISPPMIAVTNAVPQAASFEPTPFKMASRHRPIVPIALAVQTPPTTVDAPGNTEAAEPPIVAQVRTSPEQALSVSPDAAEALTSSFAVATLILMAGLPLMSLPRRRGNPSLMATLRAERRAQDLLARPDPVERLVSARVVRSYSRHWGLRLRQSLAAHMARRSILAVSS